MTRDSLVRTHGRELVQHHTLAKGYLLGIQLHQGPVMVTDYQLHDENTISSPRSRSTSGITRAPKMRTVGGAGTLSP